MTKTTRVIPMVLALASLAVTGACGKKPAAPPPAPEAQAAALARDTAAERIAREAAQQEESARRMADAATARQRFVDDSVARVRADEEALRRDSDMLRSTVTAVIGFEFNKANLRDDAKAALDAKIPILLANTSVTVRISGHADERGSTEYNLALGTERAAMAKRYLVERGVAAARIETTSFGEERPMCTENADACWAQNRRDEFEITAGAPMLTRPKS
ncbi:MAG: OmpA family protein [Gemmatimonadota bacterium]